jgi:hypothetical protein
LNLKEPKEVVVCPPVKKVVAMVDISKYLDMLLLQGNFFIFMLVLKAILLMVEVKVLTIEDHLVGALLMFGQE